MSKFPTSSSRARQVSDCFVYTYHLPYGIRRDICNLLDADQSWRALGGQFMGLDATQMTLIGQAYLRNGSPTDELLNKLDSANARISELCSYLKQMNHCRAVEILKPYIIDDGNPMNFSMDTRMCSAISNNSTLDTPTPSFSERPAAILDVCNELNPFKYDYQQNSNLNNYWAQVQELPNQINYPLPVPVAATNGGVPELKKLSQLKKQQQQQQQLRNGQPPIECHKSSSPANHQQQGQIVDAKMQPANHDPGEEIVRMACANNRKRTSISDQEVVNQLRLIMQINYNELKQASDNFSDLNVLGNGGFASVYRGNWKGTDVAIKRLKCNLMDQALNELTILNSYRIDNILPIYGISIDGPEACLVYQFMANGSLEDRLSCKNNTPPLNWNQRAMIGEGVAKGLYYLHTLRDKPLVHGDVKSANVLLDSQFVPKLGDFGLARQVFKGKNPQTELCTHCTVSSIHGTSVYLPPEYLRHKILSPAVDVYSYGIVLLEMATGKRAYDGKRLLIDIVEDETCSMSMGQISYSLKDSRLDDDTQRDLKIWYELLIKLGLNCAHKIKKKRLDMGEVLSRFANFRANSDSSFSEINYSLGYNLLNSTSGSTARTLTPNITTNGQEKGVNSTSVHHQQIPVNHSHNRQAINLNSALMSVEEESEMANYDQQTNGLQIPAHRQQESNQDENPADAVEAMIPLLTELGVVTINEGET